MPLVLQPGQDSQGARTALPPHPCRHASRVLPHQPGDSPPVLHPEPLDQNVGSGKLGSQQAAKVELVKGWRGCGRNLGRSLGSPWRALHPHPGCSRRQASGSVNKPITHLPAGPGTELEGPPGSASHPPAPPGTERGLGSTQSGEGLAVRTPQARPGPLTCASRGAPPLPWPSRGQKQTPLWGAMASENPVGWPQTSRG